MRNHLTKAGRSTCGVADPKLDYFTDVRRALHNKLMEIDPEYVKASRVAKDRHERKRAR